MVDPLESSVKIRHGASPDKLSVQAHIPDETVLVDALEPASLIMADEGQLHLTLPPVSGRMLLSEDTTIEPKR